MIDAMIESVERLESYRGGSCKSSRPSVKKCIVCGKARTRRDSAICLYCLKNFEKFGFTARQVMNLYDGVRRTAPALSFAPELIDIVEKTTKEGSRLLDVGCGEGYLSDVLKKKGYDVIAVDFSKKVLTIAKKNSHNIAFCLADASVLPFGDGAFDAVISLELVEHLLDLNAHLREVRRVLKKRGTYIIKTPNRWINKLYYMLNKREDMTFWHPSCKSYFELKELLQQFGFHVSFKPLRRFIQSHLYKMERIAGLSPKVLEKLPIKFVPVIFQPSLMCVAKK